MKARRGKFRWENSEGGNATLIALVITAAALAGISTLIDSATNARKIGSLNDMKTQQTELPKAASVMAKSLINRPASVETSLLTFWKSDGIRDHQDRLPPIYPHPYVSGNSGSAATLSTTLKSSLTSFTGLPYDASTVSQDKTVKILTQDSGRSAAANFETLLANPNYAVLNADFSTVVQRTESRVQYALSNCTSSGQPSSSFTGYYCASATIESDNYTKSMNGSVTKSGVNKGKASLGMIPVPPTPVCASVTTDRDLSSTITAGDTLQVTISASGVAVGYRIAMIANGLEIGSKDSGTGMKAFAWNTLASTTNASETIRFDTNPFKDKMPVGASVSVQAVLTAIDGSTAVCPSSRSFSVMNDKPTCELRPVQADKDYYGCWRIGQASGLVVKVTSPSIGISGNPVVTKYHGLTSGFPSLSWQTITSSNLDQGYPCTDGPCLWGPALSDDVLLPGLYEVEITGTNGKKNTYSSYVYGAWDTGYRCNMSYSENKISDSARSEATRLGITFPAGTSTVAADSKTHQKLCAMQGMKLAYASVWGSETRAGYTSCGNNAHAVWDNNTGQFVVTNACNYYWTGGLVCN